MTAWILHVELEADGIREAWDKVTSALPKNLSPVDDGALDWLKTFELYSEDSPESVSLHP